MPDLSPDNLLAQLAGRGGKGTEAWTQVKTTTPATGEPAGDKKLASALDRIQSLTGGVKPAAAAPPGSVPASILASGPDSFLPPEPKSFREGGLTDTDVESLVLKFLLGRGEASGREIADQIKLPFGLLSPLFQQMKHDQVVAHRGAAAMNDYVFQLGEIGRERARRYAEHCTYYGAAPVPLRDYITGIASQSLTKQNPSADDLRRAFNDLLISDHMLRRLGPAVNSGRGMFLFGGPGNGKTSIAERVTRAFGQFIWIPRAIGIDGEIMRLFDPTVHEECPPDKSVGLLQSQKIDERWVRIRRPTIIVGGELTMDNLEVTLNTATGISESPVQMKSNCGTLVIDDFGRQKMRVDELLNRWIVPLEKRYDYLNLPSGKKIQVPFDQLIIFSTNLEPRDLCDDAFLRRIPYKIEVINPTEAEFRRLFGIMAPKLNVKFDQAALDYLVENHYKKVNRPFRCCQPRDLLMQIKNMCLFEKREPEMNQDTMDFAVENYFAVM